MSIESRKLLAGLRRQMDQHFNLDEIQLLCFDLDIDYEHLAGKTKPKIIHELILMVSRTDRLPDLLELLAEERPTVPWPELPPDFDPAPDGSLTSKKGLLLARFRRSAATRLAGTRSPLGMWPERPLPSAQGPRWSPRAGP